MSCVNFGNENSWKFHLPWGCIWLEVTSACVGMGRHGATSACLGVGRHGATPAGLGVGRHGATPACGLECSQEEYGEVVELLVLEECIDRCVKIIFGSFLGSGVCLPEGTKSLLGRQIRIRSNFLQI